MIAHAETAHARSAPETQRRILAAAEEVFAAKGFDGARMKDIAAQAGVNPALLHHYFVDKETLYERVVERGMRALSAKGWEVLEKRPAPKEALEMWISAVTDLFHANRTLISILHRECEAGGPRIEKLGREALGPIADAVVAFLRAGQTSGDFRADLDARDVVISAFGMMAHYFHEWRMIRAIWGGDPLSDESIARRKREMTKLVLAGVAA